MHNPKVAIIILNWNGKEDTIECLESVKEITYLNYEILLVDNGSTDGSIECFRERYPGMEIIENTENLGFAEGNNVGIRRAMDEGADYVLLLNNDTVVDKEFLGWLVKVAESDPKIGFVGPKVYYYDYCGRKDVLNFAGGKLNIWKGISYHIGKNEIDNGQYNEIKKVDFVEGSCLLVKNKTIQKIGLLDSVYFTYWEENDWCMKGFKAGYYAVFAPIAKIWHKVAASNKGKKNIYYLTRNRFWFMKRYANAKQYFTFLLFFMTFQLWYLIGIYIIYKTDYVMFKCFCKGVIDGFRKIH
jgi:GT2 family glycosyltransferase